MEDSTDQSSTQKNYTVVARRYRPKTFDQLIGQDHVAQALGQAVATGRVGHAYLFTGARGVGKTSSARIFAKVLNTPEGTSPELIAEITSAIDAGEDMDVIEIDGASNRGINEIRQLRANVNVRPSRSRFKIYIIDEVHMLTKEAFNALLKTLEEPPAHVKFIFCTTDPDKIPITVLSRCQRFDFAPVKFEAILARLEEIATAEGYECEPDALALLARRAAGSMRDSQSLLEQVMSFSAGKITAEQVHALLGIADESLLLSIVEALHQNDALTAIAAADKATSAGADAGQLSEQLLNYLRDIMAVGVGGGPQLLKFASPLNHSKLQQIAQSWGLQSILSSVQILDESIVRMRSSVSSATLLEVALVQICQLQHLASIPALIASLNSGASLAQKKKPSGYGPTELVQQSNSVSSSTRLSNQVQANQVQPPQSPITAFAGSSSTPSSTSLQIAREPTPTSTLESSLTGSTKTESTKAEFRQADSTPAEFNRTEPKPANALETQTSYPSTSGPPSAESTAAADPSAPRQQVVARTDQPHPPIRSPHFSSSPEQHLGNGNGASATNGRASKQDVVALWKQATQTIEGLMADYCMMAVSIEAAESGSWRVVLPPGAIQARDYCEHPARKAQLIAAIARAAGRQVQLNFEIQPGEAPSPVAVTGNSSAERSKRMREIAQLPLIKKIIEVLDGEITKVVQLQRPPGAPK